jgi:hypothetical protein
MMPKMRNDNMKGNIAISGIEKKLKFSGYGFEPWLRF